LGVAPSYRIPGDSEKQGRVSTLCAKGVAQPLADEKKGWCLSGGVIWCRSLSVIAESIYFYTILAETVSDDINERAPQN